MSAHEDRPFAEVARQICTTLRWVECTGCGHADEIEAVLVATYNMGVNKALREVRETPTRSPKVESALTKLRNRIKTLKVQP